MPCFTYWSLGFWTSFLQSPWNNPEYSIYFDDSLVTSRISCADPEQATGIQSASLALYCTVIKCIWLLRLARDQFGRTICTSQDQGRPTLLTIPCTLNNQRFLQAILSFDMHVFLSCTWISFGQFDDPLICSEHFINFFGQSGISYSKVWDLLTTGATTTVCMLEGDKWPIVDQHRWWFVLWLNVYYIPCCFWVWVSYAFCEVLAQLV